MRRVSKFFLLALSLTLTSAFAQRASAEVRVPSIIGDNMVLQQGQKDRVWGWAAPGERVTVTFNALTARAVADERGRWQVFIVPLHAGGQFTLAVAGTNTLSSLIVLGVVVLVSSVQLY